MGRLRMLLFGALILLNGVIMRPLLVQDEFAPGEFKSGSFDVLGGEATLFLDDQFLNELFPLIDSYADGELAIPPGYSAAFPLRSNLEYRVRLIGQAAAPYAVFGTVLPLPPSTPLDRQLDDPQRPPNAAYLTYAKVVDVLAGGGLELRPWDAGRPWAADSEWLSGLMSACGKADEPLELSVRVEAEVARLTLGRCTGEASFAATDHATPMLAVLAGPHATAVKRAPEPWGYRSRVVESRTATRTQMLIVAQACVVAAAVGLVRGLVVVASLALASLLFPFEAAVVWLCAGVLGALVAAMRLAYRFGSTWGVVVVLTVIVGGTVLMLWRGDSQPAPARVDLRQAAFDAGEGPPRCLLTGYSTAADAGLHYGTPGTFDLLDSTCATCLHGVTRVAWRGGTFAQIRDTICADAAPVVDSEEVIFLGGANDDFQLPLQVTGWTERLRGYLVAARIMFFLRELPKPTPAFDAAQTLMVSVDTARRNFSGQSALIHRALDCARRRGARVWFFHDFIASDMAAGPSPGRALLLDERRSAVESSGGRFMSLLDATSDRVGVSWFNDIVHLSSIGHREVAQVICATLQSVPDPTAVPSR